MPLLVRGFTLLELLVVIAIIGLIASLTIATLSTARARSRDAKRLQDVKTIQNALNLFAATERVFPNPTATGGLCLTGVDAISKLLIDADSLSSMPKDPQHDGCAVPSTKPDETHYHYHYESIDGTTFKLWFEVENGDIPGISGYPNDPGVCPPYPCRKFITP